MLQETRRSTVSKEHANKSDAEPSKANSEGICCFSEGKSLLGKVISWLQGKCQFEPDSRTNKKPQMIHTLEQHDSENINSGKWHWIATHKESR
jgi:hypothetical protein